MNFLFVDEIHMLEPGRRTLGLKHVTPNDCYLTENSTPTLLPCIMGEALGQLCSWNVIESSDFKLRLIGGIVGEVRMFDQAYIGDTLFLESTIDTLDLQNQVVHFQGTVRTDNRLLLTVSNGLGPLLPLEEFSNPEFVKKELLFLKSAHSLPSPYAANVSAVENEKYSPHYDTILAREPLQKIIAQKTILKDSPFFPDHFPKKPVFPLSLLLEHNLQLACKFIAQDTGQQVQPIAVRKIKMMDFVLPGDTITTTLTCKTNEAEHILIHFHNEVNGKKVCVATAEFKK